MMKKEKTLRMAVTGALLLTVVAAGISMYRTDTTPKKESKTQQEQAMQEEDSKDVTSKDAEAQDTGELAKNTTENQEATPSPTMNQDNPDNAIPPTQEGENTQKTTESQESADTSAAVQPELNFTEDSQMLWPVNGQVVIDYSMDATTYFPTLDQYKYNDALMLGCESGEPVQAAANGQVVSISEDVETGTTMVMDLGNGYQATYGQLKDITVEPGQTVESGTILGYVSDPTKYYVKEGTNLYFAMTKDGNPIDPMIYIETVTE
ncbi:M23 family metallopeptidase [Blautia sp.]|uniref:M23 family metallopeptidase n=1 Tax=Blautia sp. TaxID=1955243 RepID=UPI00257ACB2E|nr:M23 family metallopeptidase [Blautia sp.]